MQNWKCLTSTTSYNKETASYHYPFGDDVWRNIESYPVVLGHKHVYLSGTMNWLAHSGIVSLELETETYNQYVLPRGVDEVPPNSPAIGVLGGCLCFSYSHRELILLYGK